MNELNYLSEEELMQLMESAEKNPVCKAPDYLKEQILRNAVKEPLSRPKPAISSIPKKQQLFAFSAKVVAAAAAAIALLIVMPTTSQLEQYSHNAALSRTQTATKQKEDSLLYKLNQKTNQFCFYLADTTNSIFIKEDYK